MDLEKLSDNDVSKLIQEVKYYFEKFTLNIPLIINKYKKDIKVKGYSSNLEYIFHAYCGRIETRYSLHIRFKETHTHLVRLCINGSRHKNSDGTELGPNHIHIYRFNGSEPEAYAYPLDNYDFDATDSLESAINKFIEFVNIQFEGSDT